MKRLLSAILILSFLIGFAPTMLPAAQAENKYPAGAIPISSVEELMLICNEYPANGDYYLTTDIDLTARTSEGGDLYNDGAGWLPIGSSETPFTGTFDGDGHSIIGLYINRPSTNNIGFFSYANNASFKNMSFQNTDITGSANTATLLASGETITIENVHLYNCAVLGRCNNERVAGIVATAIADSAITNCSVDEESIIKSTISTSSNSGSGNTMGAIAAYCVGTISSCENAADIIATYFLSSCGGIAGNATTVENCVNYGNIIETSFNAACAGGIVSSATTVSGCVNYGTISLDIKGEFHGLSDCEIRAAGVVAQATTVRCSANYGTIYSAGYATWTTY